MLALFLISAVITGEEDPSLAELDRAALRRYLTGDERGFIEVYDRHRHKMFRALARMVTDDETAAELVQDAFLRFLDALDRYDFRYAPSTLLYEIGRRLALNHLESAAVRTRAGMSPERLESVPDARQGRERDILVAEIRAVVSATLSTMRPAERAVFLARQEDGLRFDEITAALGIPERTVKRHMQRALERLAEALKAAGLEEAL